MPPEPDQPTVLSLPGSRGRSSLYLWVGLLAGTAIGVVLGYPLVLVINHLHDHFVCGLPLTLTHAILRGLTPQMLPFMFLYAVSGGLAGVIVGSIFQHVQENRRRLDELHHEFELQVTTLRHHYKNLALGIQGFSNRLKKKTAALEEYFRSCAEDDCRVYEQFYSDFNSLQQSVAILEDTAQRLTHTLGQELLFLRALTSTTPASASQDFYPLLERCVRDLLDLRFREKPLTVTINGKPFGEPQGSLRLPFEPHIMEVILQNLLTNAMKYGDVIQIRVEDGPERVRFEVADNGPGLDVVALQSRLLLMGRGQDAESTRLGLKVTLHLLARCQGRLMVLSEPGKGARFSIEIPKSFAEAEAEGSKYRLGIFRGPWRKKERLERRG
ncbi:MAG: sensor histidine kinase [Desulfobaccales bacterium]